MGWNKEDFGFYDLQRLLSKLTEHVKAFHGLTPAELTDLLEHAEKCSYDQGAVIVKEGNLGAYMYVILDGAAAVSKAGKEGEVELARLGAADTFGEMSLVDREARSATVTALSRCIVVRLNEQMTKRRPEAAMKVYRNIARVLSERLRSADELLAWRL